MVPQLSAAFDEGVKQALSAYDVNDEKPSRLRKALPWLAAAGAAGGTYGLLRKFRPSAIPELRRLQEAAKDRAFQMATTRPQGRGIRSLLTGAEDVAHDIASGGSKNPAHTVDPEAVMLQHTGGARTKARGAVNINTGQLPDAMDDKFIASQLMEHGTGGAKGMEGAIPETHLLRNLLREHKGDFEKVKQRFKDTGFVVKPRVGSMSKAENLLTHETPLADPRMRQALNNPAEFILQQKIPIQNEFRVHMLNNVPFTATHRQIPNEAVRDLWNKHMGGGGGAFVPVLGDRRQQLMDFARNATKHIGEGPQGNVLGTAAGENFHHALDIAQLPDGSFKMIESNPTPGTLMNPITARKLQRMATGRWDRGTSALGALAAGGAAGGLTHALTSRDEDNNQQI